MHRHTSSRFWSAALSLLAGLALVAFVTAAGVALLFFFTQLSTPGAITIRLPEGGIPISGGGQDSTAAASTAAASTSAASTPLPPSPTATETATPFLPAPNTPTPTTTPTPTFTPTLTPTPTTTPTITPTPTVTPTPSPTLTTFPPTETSDPSLPGEAYIYGVTGFPQALPLSCEARSAVDWARYFGVSIRELDFLNALPSTGNPNTGFVGDPHDERGNLPPSSYGVHAAPVASLLRNYGLKAESHTGFHWNDVRREIAHGRPLIVWVIGNVWTGYTGRLYNAPDGETVLVAPYEHTVIVTGYSQNMVNVVDGDLSYTVSIERFLSSWSALDNMVVISSGN